ncbi:polyprenol monophosphomannose synthase [Pirellulaceae bacterium]|jgi:dolichol-phosphate mannosyltransferase|nr:polyprenol monophosphomannose synthase [Pirellulaceae bacterium]
MNTKADLLIAVCTYNEIENIPSLYQSLRTYFPNAAILIIDDGSPDGTGKWCNKTANTDRQFFVIHREQKLGLGSASIVAFEYAIQNHFKFLLTMDGDWSHHPEHATAVVEQVADNPTVQIGIGSRYVSGGKILGWPARRHWMSVAINSYSRWMIGIPTRDCSSAFRCYRVKLLSELDFDQIQGMGYAYLEELLWHAKCKKAEIAEHPITFTNRTRGKSKINLGEALHAVWIIFKIGCRRLVGKKY